MKFLLLAMFLTMPLTATPAFADNLSFGDKIGNGGGLWACVVREKIVKSQLVDLFEAERELQFKIPAPKGSDPLAIYKAKKAWIAKNLPNFFKQVKDSFEYVERNLKIVRADLELIDDRGLFRSRPLASECAQGEWKYTQFANSNDDGEVMVQSDLWESKLVSSNDKAALLVHEGIYRWLRINKAETDSLHTRKVTGLLFSDLSLKEISANIDRIVNGGKDANPCSREVKDGEDPSPCSGTVIDKAGFFLKAADPFRETIVHQADAPYGSNVGTGNFSSGCRVPNGVKGKAADLFCILEAEELDLFFNPMNIQLHVPSNACSYVKFTPYSFYANEPGTGPAEVKHEVREDGSIRDVLNTKNGVPVCQYDYTQSGGGNCCEGNYIHTITTYTSDSSSTIAVMRNWGGSAKNCLVSPGMAMPGMVNDPKGYPLPRLEYTAGVGLNRTENFPAAQNTFFQGNNLHSNLFTANFYNPGDHAEGKPEGLKPRMGFFTPQEFYKWECLDASGTPKARIRLMIREWNTSIQEGGDPDQNGFDSDFPDYERNNIFDWKDFGSTFPGTLLRVPSPLRNHMR